MPNFRGIEGYGEELLSEIGSYNIMSKPYEDVMAGIDFLVKEGIANPDELGIYGTSFGAWLTAWAIGQTGRFKGAIGMVSITTMSYLLLDTLAIRSLQTHRRGKEAPRTSTYGLSRTGFVSSLRLNS